MSQFVSNCRFVPVWDRGCLFRERIRMHNIVQAHQWSEQYVFNSGLDLFTPTFILHIFFQSRSRKIQKKQGKNASHHITIWLTFKMCQTVDSKGQRRCNCRMPHPSHFTEEWVLDRNPHPSVEPSMEHSMEGSMMLVTETWEFLVTRHDSLLKKQG